MSSRKSIKTARKDLGTRSGTREAFHLVPALLRWFGKNARDLPWRRTRDPYAIWVSEIMLQQTQVKTVIPYWERWMQALPSVESLAGATSEEIHKLWEGLGYYTRVRNMQRAAQVVLHQHNGVFPTEFEVILALPGVGRYTAGAVCSIAFNQPKPVLDGNVIRVLTRLFGIAGNPREQKVRATLWQLAENLVSHAAGMEFSEGDTPAACSYLNQSLMELGALICTPKEPRCALCPLINHCIARRENRTGELPNISKRVAATHRRFVAFVAEWRGRYLVRQRPAGVVNGHLWEFPNLELLQNDDDLRKAARLALGITPMELAPLCTIRHAITRYRIEMRVFRARMRVRPKETAKNGRWFTPRQIARATFASAHKKILGQLGL